MLRSNQSTIQDFYAQTPVVTSKGIVESHTVVYRNPESNSLESPEITWDISTAITVPEYRRIQKAVQTDYFYVLMIKSSDSPSITRKPVLVKTLFEFKRMLRRDNDPDIPATFYVRSGPPTPFWSSSHGDTLILYILIVITLIIWLSLIG